MTDFKSNVDNTIFSHYMCICIGIVYSYTSPGKKYTDTVSIRSSKNRGGSSDEGSSTNYFF